MNIKRLVSILRLLAINRYELKLRQTLQYIAVNSCINEKTSRRQYFRRWTESSSSHEMKTSYEWYDSIFHGSVPIKMSFHHFLTSTTTSKVHEFFHSARLDFSMTPIWTILRGPYRQVKKSLWFVRFWLNFAHICKTENKIGKPSWTFSIFFVENELFTENLKRGGGPRSRTERSNGSTYTVDTYINRSGSLCSTKL